VYYPGAVSIASAALTILLVIDPFGNVPVFLSILEGVGSRRRSLVILREMGFAFVVLTCFLFFGKYILAGMSITQPAVTIAGGVVLFLIALRMVFPGQTPLSVDPAARDPFIVPLAIPLIAGPSTLATLVLLSTSQPEFMGRWFAALAIACGASTVVLLLSDVLRRILGTRVLLAIERLMGMILTAIAVQMLLTGLREYLQAVRS
jgi:multiple antibiotic resistance protein